MSDWNMHDTLSEGKRSLNTWHLVYHLLLPYQVPGIRYHSHVLQLLSGSMSFSQA